MIDELGNLLEKYLDKKCHRHPSEWSYYEINLDAFKLAKALKAERERLESLEHEMEFKTESAYQHGYEIDELIERLTGYRNHCYETEQYQVVDLMDEAIQALKAEREKVNKLSRAIWQLEDCRHADTCVLSGGCYGDCEPPE